MGGSRKRLNVRRRTMKAPPKPCSPASTVGGAEAPASWGDVLATVRGVARDIWASRRLKSFAACLFFLLLVFWTAGAHFIPRGCDGPSASFQINVSAFLFLQEIVWPWSNLCLSVLDRPVLKGMSLSNWQSWLQAVLGYAAVGLAMVLATSNTLARIIDEERRRILDPSLARWAEEQLVALRRRHLVHMVLDFLTFLALFLCTLWLFCVASLYAPHELTTRQGISIIAVTFGCFAVAVIKASYALSNRKKVRDVMATAVQGRNRPLPLEARTLRTSTPLRRGR